MTHSTDKETASPTVPQRRMAKSLPAGATQHATAGPYSPVLEVRADRLIVISGQVAVDAEGAVIGQSIEEQARATLENCRCQLATAGCSFDDVFKVNVYLTDLSMWARFNVVYASVMPDPKPVRTAIGSALLMKWQELKTTDLASISRDTPVVLPVAAIEQHGPHLPLATDRLIAEHFADAINSRLGAAVLILPTVAVGCSEHHMDFAGSLTVRHDTFSNVVQDNLESAYRHGFRNLFVLNAHGGNQGIGQVIVEQFGANHPDTQTALATWWRVASDELALLNETGMGGVGHACEFETSLMLLIAPHLVNMEAAPLRTNVATYPWAEGDLLRGAQVSLFRTMQQMTPSGVYGEPRAASADKGQQISQLVTDKLVQILNDFRLGGSSGST
jgi:creatinine amidohydrolase